MHELADEYGIAELHELAEHTRRRAPLRIVQARWPRLTEHQKAAVREAFVSNPHLGVRELADRFHTSIGRISEAIRGKRE
ncbi:hypothetical protein FHY02_001823 [Sphingomonas sp. BK069]|nr:hypothetical protein [Sphingomonas sp. BK069]